MRPNRLEEFVKKKASLRCPPTHNLDFTSTNFQKKYTKQVQTTNIHHYNKYVLYQIRPGLFVDHTESSTSD